MEFQVRIGREVGELRRRQVGNVAVIGIFGVRPHERALAPVGVGYFVVEIAGNAFENVFAAIPPRSLARTPCREIHKVGDAFGRLREVPHPRIVGFVEARFGFSHSASVMIVHFEASMALRAYVAASAYFDESKPPSQR